MDRFSKTKPPESISGKPTNNQPTTSSIPAVEDCSVKHGGKLPFSFSSFFLIKTNQSISNFYLFYFHLLTFPDFNHSSTSNFKRIPAISL